MDAPKRVALCVTCIVDQLMPEVGLASVKLLRRAGCQVTFPTEQTCCGQPFFNSGFRQQASHLAKRTIQIFEGQENIVLPSGSCTSMIRLEYPHLLEKEPEWLTRARDMGSRTYELSEFLVKQIGWEPAARSQNSPDSDEENSPGPQSKSKPCQGALTYHDSCHMNRGLGLSDEPRQLIKSAALSLCEMSESDRCCGFGGVFSARLPEVSTAMTAEKLHQAANTGASTIVTADPGCLMQMRGLVDGSDLRIKHLAVVLEEMTR